MTRLVAILAALAAPASAGSLPQVSGVILDDSYAPSAKTKAPPERPGEWECWVLRTDHPYIYRLDWRQPSPEWDLAHYREACQRPHSPRRYAPSSAPRFPVTASPPKHDKPWWDGLSSPAQIPRGRESEGMPDDFFPPR